MPINVTGVDSTLKALRKFDPDLNRAMNKEIKKAMIPIRNNARGFLPNTSEMLRNWQPHETSPEANYSPFPQYSREEASAGIIYRQGYNKKQLNGWAVSYYVANTSPAGAIYETAGRVNPDGRPTSHTITINKRYKPIKITSRSTKDSQSNNPNAGRQFINSMGGTSNLYGKDKDRGRLIFRAWEKDYGKATLAVEKAINTAINQFNQSSFTLAA
jgi:hypothetical protein